jgi:hypothetical protein
MFPTRGGHIHQDDRGPGLRTAQGSARRGREVSGREEHLAERAAKGTKIEEGLKNLAGVTSIAYTTGDPVAMAKALTKYAKDTPEFTFKWAWSRAA